MQARNLAVLVTVVTLSVTAFFDVSLAQSYKVGVRVDGAPYVFADEQTGIMQGYYVDLIQEIGRRTGLEFEYKRVPFSKFASALVSGEIDIIAANFGITDQRRAMGIAYSTPTSLSTDGMIVPAIDRANHLTFDDFAGKVVGAIAGTTHDVKLTQMGIFKEVKTYATSDELVAAVGRGDVLAARLAGAGIAYDLKVRGLFPKVRFVDSYIPTQNLQHAIAARQTDLALLNAINAAVAKLAADGTMSALASKWHVPLPISPFLKPE